MSKKLLTGIALTEQSAPSTPASGLVELYAKTDGRPYIKDDGGTEVALAPTALKGFVNHGSTAGTARPTGYASIEWYGSVEPSNAVAGDTWVDTA